MNNFRDLIRQKQKLTEEECVSILINEKRGVLSVNGDNGYPYGMPMNHFYQDGVLYFHGSKVGHKIDSLRKDNKVSYCVYDQGYKNENEWHLNIKSVVVFGKMELIEDPSIIEDISRKLSYKSTNDDNYIEEEIKKSLNGTLLLALKIENMTGKIVKEK